MTKDDNEESWNDFDSKEDLSEPKLEDDSEGTLRKEKYQITKEKQDEVFSHIRADRLDREIGVEVGNICPICLEGQVENLGGCNTCTNCGAQLACDA